MPAPRTTSFDANRDMDLRSGIVATADALGMSPADLATIISYETGGTFNPAQPGPTTKWGQHRGLIQFGEPQAKQYGVDWGDPLGSQLGPEGAIVRYFQGSGWKPGMGMLDAYSIVNAGGPGRYDASDTAAGGAPGTVRDKVEQQMAAHRQKAAALLGEGYATGGGLAVRHPPNPVVGTPAAPQQVAAATAKKEPPAPWWKRLGKGIADASLSGQAPPPATYQAPQQPMAAMASGPAVTSIDPQQAEMQRAKMAEALARLNSGQLIGGPPWRG